MSYSWIIFAICILLCGHSTLSMKCRTNEGRFCWVLISLSYKTEGWKSWDGGFVLDENIRLLKTCYDTRCQSCAHCPNGCDILYRSTPFSCSKCALCCPKLKLPKVRKCCGSNNKWRKCKIWYELCTPDPTTKSYVECLLQEPAADEHITQSFDCPPRMRAHPNKLTERTIFFGFCSICGIFMILGFMRKRLMNAHEALVVPPPQNLPSTGTGHAGATGGRGMRVDIVRGELSTNIHNDYTIPDIYSSQLVLQRDST